MWDLDSWLVDPWREGVPSSESERLKALLGIAAGNLLIGASEMPLADSGEYVYVFQQKQGESQAF